MDAMSTANPTAARTGADGAVHEAVALRMDLEAALEGARDPAYAAGEILSLRYQYLILSHTIPYCLVLPRTVSYYLILCLMVRS